MIHNKLLISAAVALLACTACEQQTGQQAQTDQVQTQPTAADEATAPSTMDQDTSTVEAAQTGIPLNDVENPEQTLARSQVTDAKGEAIGEVKSVALNADGSVQMVTVTTGNRDVAMAPSGLTYVQAQNTIVSDKSKAEIDEAPAETPTP